MNAGVYRYSPATGAVTPVVIPGATPAPGDGVFAGSHFGASLNVWGHLAFPGIVTTDKGLPFPEQLGLGVGIFKARKNGAISSVVSPGDAAPGGGAFDFAAAPWINNWSDVAFQGHVAGDECLASSGFPPPPSSSPVSRASTSRSPPPARSDPSPRRVTTPRRRRLPPGYQPGPERLA